MSSILHYFWHQPKKTNQLFSHCCCWWWTGFYSYLSTVIIYGVYESGNHVPWTQQYSCVISRKTNYIPTILIKLYILSWSQWGINIFSSPPDLMKKDFSSRYDCYNFSLSKIPSIYKSNKSVQSSLWLQFPWLFDKTWIETTTLEISLWNNHPLSLRIFRLTLRFFTKTLSSWTIEFWKRIL